MKIFLILTTVSVGMKKSEYEAQIEKRNKVKKSFLLLFDIIKTTT